MNAKLGGLPYRQWPKHDQPNPFELLAQEASLKLAIDYLKSILLNVDHLDENHADLKGCLAELFGAVSGLNEIDFAQEATLSALLECIEYIKNNGTGIFHEAPPTLLRWGVYPAVSATASLVSALPNRLEITDFLGDRGFVPAPLHEGYMYIAWPQALGLNPRFVHNGRPTSFGSVVDGLFRPGVPVALTTTDEQSRSQTHWVWRSEFIQHTPLDITIEVAP